MKKTLYYLIPVSGLVLIIVLYYQNFLHANVAEQQPIISVSVSPVMQRDVIIDAYVVGSVEAYSTVMIKSQIDGHLVGVGFKEGDIVQAQQELFTIDPRPLQIQLQRVQAELLRDKAQLQTAQSTLKRNLSLSKQGYLSQQDTEQLQNNVSALQATIKADEAAVAEAQLELSYSKIFSPISGRTGNLLVQPGNLIKANDVNPLVVINQITPIYVMFSLPEEKLSQLQGDFHKASIPVWISPDKDKQQFTLLGSLSFIEIAAMILAAIGFAKQNLVILLITLLLMGAHSTFFGPIKYSILPDHLHQDELIGGNAYIEGSTFLAILFGTILGGVLITLPAGNTIVSYAGIAIAVLGLLVSFYIPKAKSHAPDLKVSFNIFQQTWAIIRYAKQDTRIFLSILGISWFWLVGSAFLSQFPIYTKESLHADSHLVTVFLTMFSVGIAMGSLLCERLQKGEINAKYVPLGMIGMSIFIFDLFIATSHHTIQISATYSTVPQFLHNLTSWRILFDILMIAVMGGLFIVPLYTFIQVFAEPAHRSRIIAANNIINAVFMVISTIAISVLLILHLTTPQIFLVIGLFNIVATAYACRLLPEALVKTFVCWLLKILYRVEIKGMENYHRAGKRMVIVANHVSFLDAVLLSAFIPDRTLFVVNTQIAQLWWVKPFLSLLDTFKLDPTKPMTTKSLIKAIQQDQRCIIFPEGRLTMTGALMKIYEGPGTIADTPFTRLKGKVRIRWFPRITITLLPHRRFEVSPSIKGRQRRRLISAKLYTLMTDLIFESSDYHKTLFQSLIDAKHIHGNKHKIAEDIARKPINYRQFLIKCFALGDHIAKSSDEGEAIGVLLPNMVASAITFFAIQADQRIAAMLNFSLGVKNILTACRTAQIKTIYSSQQFIETAHLEDVISALQENHYKIVYLEELTSQINLWSKWRSVIKGFFPNRFYRVDNSPENADKPAVILFTSGSEGDPKGVALSHANIQANCYQLSAVIDFNSQDMVFNALPIFHAFGLTGGTILPILSGIKAFFYPSPLHYRIIPELAYDANATILFGTDTFLAGYGRAAHPYDFYSIRYVFSGAEKLKPETKNLWIEKFGIRIFEGYGATETAPVLAINTPMLYQANSVGRFLPKINYRLESVDGIAEGGRLFVNGPNIMLGYLRVKQPGKIIPPADNWYDTGDIVTLDELGFIYIVGRAKRFAKIAGEMVSLTAVENAITNLSPNFLHAVVAIPDIRKGEQLILVTEDETIQRDKIIYHFKHHGVSEISIPKKIIIVEKIPLLATGKVDYVSVQKLLQKQLK